MWIAVPTFRDEVSPRFGCSPQLLLVQVEDGQVVCREFIDWSSMPPPDRPAFVASRGACKVICGGLHERFSSRMQALGIEVIYGVIGSADEAIEACLAGRLVSNQRICMQGHRRGGRRRRRGSGKQKKGEYHARFGSHGADGKRGNDRARPG